MQRMRSKLTNIIIFTVAFFSFGCSMQEDSQLFVVAEAFDVRTVRETDWHEQTTYKVKMKYPMTAISKVTLNKLTLAGWSKCIDSSTKWERFIDESKKPNRIINQQIIKFTKNDELVTIGMMYFSVMEDMKSSDLTPENTIQNIYIAHDYLSKVPNELKQQYQELYGNCTPA